MNKVLQIFGAIITVFALTACPPYGDSKNDLGIIDSNVSTSGLAKSWEANNGAAVTVMQDGTFQDATCGRQGEVVYVSENARCPENVSKCGSVSFSFAPFNHINGCASTEKIVCSFYIASSTGPTTLQLACADSYSKIDYFYRDAY